MQRFVERRFDESKATVMSLIFAVSPFLLYMGFVVFVLVIYMDQDSRPS